MTSQEATTREKPEELQSRVARLEKEHEELIDKVTVLENALITLLHDPNAQHLAILKSSGYFDRMSESLENVVPSHRCGYCHEMRPRFRVASCPCLAAQYCTDKNCQQQDWARHRNAEHLDARLHQAGHTHEDLKRASVVKPESQP